MYTCTQSLKNPLPNSGSPSQLIASSTGSSPSFRGSERNFCTAWSSRVLHTYDEFGNRARVVQVSGSPITRRSQCCMHANTSNFGSGSSTSRVWFNVCRQVGSPEWAGRRTLKYVSSEQETDCLLHMLGVGNVLSTTNLLAFSFQ